MTRPAALLFVCSLALAATWPSSSLADTSKAPSSPAAPARSMWRPEWATFSRAEGVATVAAGVGTGVLFMLKPPRAARWEGGIWFNEDVRSTFRLKSPSARKQIRAWGDVPYYTAPLLPLVIDPLVAAWAARGDRKAALNLELVSLESFSNAELPSFASTRIAAPGRPESSECRRTADATETCEVDADSFYDGHTRSVSDRHYATDVLADLGMRSGTGYVVPTLLHYSDEETNVSVTIQPGGPCTGACLKVAGSF
ncbi:MAG: hypothetical protein EOO73_17280 [Myxococcales bacterium]|nr:MAG: hypothetical protein EOO73_17280 [Myxococcales bacterium]